MSTQTPVREELRSSVTTFAPSKLFTVVAILAFVIGAGSILGGAAGAVYTYQQAAVENIVTPPDASIPETPVRGPLTMKSQIDIINEHQLAGTEGLRYAEMAREVPQVDEAGNPILDEAGEPVMGPNQARMSWITATSLTSVLSLGIMAYALAAFAIVLGIALIALGLVVRKLRFVAA